jgi:two-component system alkaline phosphatase synthesis response regulator PhoP
MAFSIVFLDRFFIIAYNQINMAKRILIVDDDSEIVSTLGLRFEAIGYEVIGAYDGLEALQKARNEHPDVILLDIMLPKLDGYKVCRMLKFDEKYKHIPIIILTAKVEEHNKKLGKEVGAEAYVTKPFDTSELINTIKGFVEQGG